MAVFVTNILVALWVERPTSVRRVMGSIPVRDSAFFPFSLVRDRWIQIFLILFTERNITNKFRILSFLSSFILLWLAYNCNSET